MDCQKITYKKPEGTCHEFKSFLCFLAVFTEGCSEQIVSIKDIKSNDIYLMESPSQRLKNQEYYFSHENNQINSRRGNKDFKGRPENLIGLALSGGGIRSSEYQLGLISGLHKINKLNKIDYISSVSGGSWANGSYWANNSSDEEFFNCLDRSAELGRQNAKCKMQNASTLKY